MKAAWHKRFQAEPSEIKAVDKLMVFEQGTLPSDSAREFNIEVLDPLTSEDFAWLPLPTMGCLSGPQCAALCAHLHTYLSFYAPPTSPTDDEVAVGDILAYVTKVAREFRTQRYDDNNAPLMYVCIEVGQASCSALLDSGASRNFMSQAFMQKAGLGAQVRRKANPTAIKLADGKTQQLLDRYIEAVPVYFAPHACEPVTFDILDTDFDIILGMPWLASADHTVNFHRRTLSVCNAFGAKVACTIPLPHCSIRCQVVTAKSFRATCAYEQPEEIGLCFLRTVAVADTSPMDLSSDPRVVQLLDEFANIFESSTGVVPDRPISHEIILEAGAMPPKGCIYRMSEEELEVLRAQLDDLLAKGWIRPSSSPYGASVLFVRKKNKDPRLCIDYRKLNAQTVKNAGPPPRIDDLLERLGGAKYFSKMDLKSGYHQISIRPNDRYKSAFKTRYGHFEWVVMPFGLTNAPTTFQATMTNEFRAMLDRFVLVYLDDILVYSGTLEDHLGHLRRVLETLRRAKYKAKRDKCEFVRQELEYLGHFVTPEGISPLSDKIQAIQEWLEPRNVTDVRSFLGLAGYYQCFIKGYSKIAAHLTKLQCEDRPFDFGEEAWESFLALKAVLLYAEVLLIYDPLLPTRVTTDASHYGIGAVLEQHDGVDWHPVEYFSKKVPVVHSIDDARKKELLAFVHALKRWRHFLLGRSQFRWVTDNNLLVFYKTQDTVNSTIARWMAFIDQFNFFPDHILGKSNRFADALSRRPEHCTAVYSTFEIDDDLRNNFIRGYQADPEFRDKYAAPSHYRIQEGYLLARSLAMHRVSVSSVRSEVESLQATLLQTSSITSSCGAVETFLRENRDRAHDFFASCFPLLLRKVFGFRDRPFPEASSPLSPFPQGTLAGGWLQHTSHPGHEGDAIALVSLLSPTGILLQSLLNIDKEGTIMFLFPSERLPDWARLLLRTEEGASILCRESRLFKRCISRQGDQPFQVRLGLLDFYFFWFAYYARCKGNLSGRSSRHGSGGGQYYQQQQTQGRSTTSALRSSLGSLKVSLPGMQHSSLVCPSVYRHLLLLYLEHFLPFGHSGSAKVPSPTSGQVSTDYENGDPRQTTYPRERVCFTHPLRRAHVSPSRQLEGGVDVGNCSPHQSRQQQQQDLALYGAKFLDILVEFWLLDGDRAPLCHSFQQQRFAATITTGQQEPVLSHFLPGDELLASISVLVSHVCSDPQLGDSAGGGKSAGIGSWAGDALLPRRSSIGIQGESGKGIRTTDMLGNGMVSRARIASASNVLLPYACQVLQRPLYRFLRRAFAHWPVEDINPGRLDMLVGIWITYIAPWSLPQGSSAMRNGSLGHRGARRGGEQARAGGGNEVGGSTSPDRRLSDLFVQYLPSVFGGEGVGRRGDQEQGAGSRRLTWHAGEPVSTTQMTSIPSSSSSRKTHEGAPSSLLYNSRWEAYVVSNYLYYNILVVKFVEFALKMSEVNCSMAVQRLTRVLSFFASSPALLDLVRQIEMACLCYSPLLQKQSSLGRNNQQQHETFPPNVVNTLRTFIQEQIVDWEAAPCVLWAQPDSQVPVWDRYRCSPPAYSVRGTSPLPTPPPFLPASPQGRAQLDTTCLCLFSSEEEQGGERLVEALIMHVEAQMQVASCGSPLPNPVVLESLKKAASRVFASHGLRGEQPTAGHHEAQSTGGYSMVAKGAPAAQPGLSGSIRATPLGREGGTPAVCSPDEMRQSRDLIKVRGAVVQHGVGSDRGDKGDSRLGLLGPSSSRPALGRHTWAEVRYKGDWMKRPVEATEIGWLVEQLVKLSNLVNRVTGLDQETEWDRGNEQKEGTENGDKNSGRAVGRRATTGAGDANGAHERHHDDDDDDDNPNDNLDEQGMGRDQQEGVKSGDRNNGAVDRRVAAGVGGGNDGHGCGDANHNDPSDNLDTGCDTGRAGAGDVNGPCIGKDSSAREVLSMILPSTLSLHAMLLRLHELLSNCAEHSWAMGIRELRRRGWRVNLRFIADTRFLFCSFVLIILTFWVGQWRTP
ncbi:hypothetical protein CBR_g16835 [Chara braunii]|uniref:RNA-directed DNA polymerase n=1 Tax=Chara braunii TaxID=69332 RepID=A0A388KTV2_CHABU|nr:hypothetical protein CBR_g16835 [Chara braunii]|eukprot:GBG73494.1 hypothetical protein CBR_g16835 [Chara braunii]